MGMLTVRERQKTSSPAKEFISKMQAEYRGTHPERIERGIAFLAITLVLGFVVWFFLW
ncbi:MAG: hypothetical protein Q7S49_00320 [bacterium]|nr:hypothetical protein [bacterium]